MNTGNKLGICVFILLLLGFSQSMRAQDFTPQTGTWVINEEANGEPGRGFQIEVQNDILVLYFYGYEPGGRLGVLGGYRSFSARLQRNYRRPG